MRLPSLLLAGLLVGSLTGCGPSKPAKVELWTSAESIARAYRENADTARDRFEGEWAGVATVFESLARQPGRAVVADRMGNTYAFSEDALIELMRLRPNTPLFIFGRIDGYELSTLQMTHCFLDDAQFAHEADLRNGGAAPAVSDASRVRLTVRLADGPRPSESIEYARFGAQGVARLDIDLPLAAGLKAGDVVEVIGSLSMRGDIAFLWAHQHRKLP